MAIKVKVREDYKVEYMCYVLTVAAFDPDTPDDMVHFTQTSEIPLKDMHPSQAHYIIARMKESIKKAFPQQLEPPTKWYKEGE